MARKRQSLADIAKQEAEQTKQEDNAHIKLAPPVSVPGAKKPEPPAEALSISEPPSESSSAPSVAQPKADYLKVTVTLPPDLFEQLDDVGRYRRRRKQPHTLSQVVREALELYLPTQPPHTK